MNLAFRVDLDIKFRAFGIDIGHWGYHFVEPIPDVAVIALPLLKNIASKLKYAAHGVTLKATVEAS